MKYRSKMFVASLLTGRNQNCENDVGYAVAQPAKNRLSRHTRCTTREYIV